jgi:hypothetical protein
MAKDLPQRPKPDPDTPVKKVAATDRVKAKTDKVDPRFEAARQRIAREEERRARAAAARRAKQAEAEVDQPAGDDDDAQDEPKKGFSFNQTNKKDTP